MSKTAIKNKIEISKTKDHPLTNHNLSKSDYEEPIKYGNYMKIEEGENKFRILSEGIVGTEAWETYEDEEGKEKKRPYRVLEGEKMQIGRIDSESKTFEAYFVYNYKAGKIQILNVTQKSITRGIRKFTKDESWGSPLNYDLVITKTVGNNPRYDTSYSVIAKPPFVLDSYIQKQWVQSGFSKNHLYLLFANLDPFSVRALMEREEDTSSALLAIQPGLVKAEVAC